MEGSFIKSAKSLGKMIPVWGGTILLLGLADATIPKSLYVKLFNHSGFFSSLIGSIAGSISAGNPITSYILGGEMLKQGIGLVAVTAFLVSWVTVGIIQLPAEAVILGKKFAVLRNFSAFILSTIVAIITVLIFNLLQ